MQQASFPLSGAALAIAFAAALAPHTAAATTGTITFNGQLTDATCDVRGGTLGTQSFSVDLPTISTSQLLPGDTAGRTLFRMALANCPALAGGVRVFFEDGPQVDPFTGTLITSIPSVNLALFNDDGTPIAIGHESQRTGNLLYQSDEVMHYQVAYHNVGPTNATPGPLAASVVYSLHYP